MRLAFVLLFLSLSAGAQIPLGQEALLGRLQPAASLPEQLLSTRSVVFDPHDIDIKALMLMQRSFQETGIDAVLYIQSDFLAAGRDPSVALAEYLNAREISHIIIAGKDNGYSLYVAPYNQLATLVDEQEPAWFKSGRDLEKLLQDLFKTANSTLERGNLLINEYPELGMPLNIFKGRRADFFAIDLKVDPLAIPQFGDAGSDRELEQIMKGYPFKYKLTDAGLSEAQIRQNGSYYVLRFVYARSRAAQHLLGYDLPKSQSAIASITYPDSLGDARLKTIPADAMVYKFYFKHIDSGNIFLGTRWDADVTWQQALRNQLRAFKRELNVN